MQATPVLLATLWVLRTDVEGARYATVKNVDLQQTVDDFTARCVTELELGVNRSLVTLRLVKCGEDEPAEAEETAAAAAPVLRSSLSLAKSGVTGTAWLRAYVATPAAGGAFLGSI